MWRLRGESNPYFQVENLASLPLDDGDNLCPIRELNPSLLSENQRSLSDRRMGQMSQRNMSESFYALPLSYLLRGRESNPDLIMFIDVNPDEGLTRCKRGDLNPQNPEFEAGAYAGSATLACIYSSPDGSRTHTPIDTGS